MSTFMRKAAFGLVASAIAGTAACVTAGAATAAPATPAAQTTTVHTMAVKAAARLDAVALSWPQVVQGATGERVFAIQYLLNQRIGAGLALDGKFGPATTAAVRKFQAKFKLQVDGKVGPQTWTHLIVQVQNGSSGSAVAAVQHNLRFAYGFTSLAVDGKFGPATTAAVRSFQAKFKIGVDGIVGPITWNTLVVHEG
jgi:peptidoglycan hydrolase-like protein with peptidoglycan-binding domain